MKKPIKIAVSGSSGNIGYALMFRIAAGELFGPDQPVILSSIEVESSRQAAEALMLELQDCAFDNLMGASYTLDPAEGFADSDYVILLGAKPRGPNMERKDLLIANAEIFHTQGRALNESVSRDTHILVVGNPANTNALIALKNAPKLPSSCFSALMRLDHSRAIGMLARKMGCRSHNVKKMIVWGNHSSTQFIDITHAEVVGEPALEEVTEEWWHDTLIPDIQQRGAEIIKARGSSSAASAANAIIEHVKFLKYGTPADDWTSMAVLSDGSYGVQPELMFSFPTVSSGDNDWRIVQDLVLTEYERHCLQVTQKELCEERDAVAAFLK